MAVDLVAKREISNATVHSSVITIPQGAKEAELFIDRTSLLDNRVAIAVQCFFSKDDGVTWLPWGGFGCCGGAIENSETREVETKSGMLINLPSPELSKRKLMATLTTPQAANTDLKVEFR